MGTLLERPVQITQLKTTTVAEARALEDPARAALLDLLSRQALSVQEMVAGLKELGFDKAPTTIRHHLEVLKAVGLVELVRVQEVKGGVLKYYSSRARYLGYEAPQDFDSRLGGPIADSAEQLLKVIDRLVARHGPVLKSVAANLKPCPYCSPQHFEEYVLLEVLHRSIARATQQSQFKRLLAKIRARKTRTG